METNYIERDFLGSPQFFIICIYSIRLIKSIIIYYAYSRMGSAQSVQTVSDVQKSSGIFKLSNNQELTVKILVDLFHQFIEDNNVFTLEKVLKDSDYCKNLFIVLSSSLEKDFRTLRFPDPLQPDDTLLLSFMAKQDYDNLANNPVRKTLCGNIVFFMIRLVTLVAAVVASLRVNKDIIHNLDLIKYESQGVYNRRYKSPYFNEEQKKIISSRNPIDENVMKKLTESEQFVHVRLEDSDAMDKRNIYYFRGSENAISQIVIDVKQSIAYISKTDDGFTPVWGIEITEVDARKLESLRSKPAYGNMGLGAYPRRPPYGPGGIQLGGKSRKSKIQRIALRFTRKNQRGGAKYIFLLTAHKLFSSSTVIDKMFIMEEDGRTYNDEEYSRYKRDEILAPHDVSSFQDRFFKLFEQEQAVKVPLVEMKDNETAYEKFAPFFQSDDNTNTLAAIKHVFETVNKKPEGTSPAFYRAYLLAARLDGAVLQTLFCQDMWSGRNVMGQVSYALLHSLYCTRQDGSIDSDTRQEYTEVMNSYLPYFEKTGEGASAVTLENLQFKARPRDLDPICLKYVKGSRPITDPREIEILTQAHKNLHSLYENHITACVNVLSKVVSLDQEHGYSKPTINLEQIFVNNKDGAQTALDSVIKEARQLISTHFLQVESVYLNALNEISSFSRGSIPVKKDEPVNVLEAVSDKLPPEINVPNSVTKV